MITYDDFLKLDIPKDFGSDDAYGESPEMDAVFNQLPDSCCYEYGASQYVIITGDLDDVIKIPFRGTYYYNEDNDIFFEPFNFCRDYCERSVHIYEAAKEAGVADLFVETKFLGYTRDHYPIYTQERIEATYGSDEMERTPSRDSMRKMEKMEGHHRFPDQWLAIAIDNYGEEIVKKFIEFCEENCEDLHYENIGYKKDGSAVVIDYAGFHY